MAGSGSLPTYVSDIKPVQDKRRKLAGLFCFLCGSVAEIMLIL